MHEGREAARTRRAFMKTGGVLAGALVMPGAIAQVIKQPKPTGTPEPLLPQSWAAPKVAATPVTSSKVVRPQLLQRALASLDSHAGRGLQRDRIVIADFAAPSSQKRFHLIDLVGGKSESLLVAHGSGSDPAHTGWLQRFSNQDGSNASCEGAFLASDYYVGKHGRSQRLIGLDPTNSNALNRAIVVHAAWYSNPDMLKTHGMLGRSQGCFAVGDADLQKVFDRLGQNRLIYAAKV
jgi:hypothetical protein